MKNVKTIHIVWLIAIAYVAVLWSTASSVGFTRDEGYYFKAAQEYSGWWGVLFSSRFFDAFTATEIAKHFSYNTEHPPLVKLCQGITYHVFSEWLGVTSPSTGFRVTGFLFGGFSLVATYLLAKELVDERTGVLAALFMAVMPRYFFDAHLACFDVPITAMWTFSIYMFVRALRAPRGQVWRRAIQCGVVFGLALATKLNALFLPFVFILLWLIEPPDPLAPRLVRAPLGGTDVRLPRVPIVLWTCAIIGPLVFIATWPHLWHDTFGRINAYLLFHMHHEHYPALYLGDLLIKPPFPWHFPVVMTFYTVPAPIVLLGALGLLRALVAFVRRRNLADGLLLVGVALPVFLIAMPDTPIFGGVKHWYNALPALSILAARALWGSLDAFDFGSRPAIAYTIAALTVVPGALAIQHSHPNGIGFYNELAGGYVGAARIGMQRGFWGGLAYPLYPTLNERTVGPTRVFFNRTNYDSYKMYRREDVFERRFHYANEPRGAQVAVDFAQPEHAEQQGAIWSWVGTRPVAGVYQDNVTLIQLYVKGQSNAPPP